MEDAIESHLVTTSLKETWPKESRTVIWLDPAFWEFRDSSLSTVEQLREVGIFHDSRDSAVQHISEI